MAPFDVYLYLILSKLCIGYYLEYLLALCCLFGYNYPTLSLFMLEPSFPFLSPPDALVPSLQVDCKKPSVLCKETLLCISEAQLCDGTQDCPDGSDEATCVELCLKRGTCS